MQNWYRCLAFDLKKKNEVKIIPIKVNFSLSMQNSNVEIEIWFLQDFDLSVISDYPYSEKPGPTCTRFTSAKGGDTRVEPWGVGPVDTSGLLL